MTGDLEHSVEGWFLIYRRPDLDGERYAGPFLSEDEAEEYAAANLSSYVPLAVEWGSLSITPKPQIP